MEIVEEPSWLFREFIRKFPMSSSAEEWQKWGNQIPKHSGHFTTYLYQGNLFEAINRADSQNGWYLIELLFPHQWKDIPCCDDCEWNDSDYEPERDESRD